MAYKLLVLAGLVALVRAGVLSPLAARLEDADYDPNPQYTFAYEVQDALTGDSKNQFETRNGDIVQGRYSLIEPDGSRRTVDYTADPINGFNAIVQREGVVVAVPAKVAAAPVLAARAVTAPVLTGPVVAIAPARAAARGAVAPVPATNTLAEAVPEGRRVAERVSAARIAEEPSPARTSSNQQNAPEAGRSLAKAQSAETLALARLGAPLTAGTRAAPDAPRPAAAAVRLAHPTAALAYPGAVAAPYARLVTQLGYPAAYTTLI